MGKPIYVEIMIQAPLEELWRLTQSPDFHQRWDLRFTRIAYLPRPDPAKPQRFRYETRVGFGLAVSGEGETVGDRDLSDGTRSSALRFWSADPKSLIREGSGYWKYVPAGGSIRFLTRYDYTPRFGPPGRWLDALVFRPLLGWATAWSFDRLRRWLEQGREPETALRQALIHAVARGALAAVWIYQGLVPKLLAPEGGELAILRATGLLPGREGPILVLLGLAEVSLGLVMLARPAWRWPLGATLLVLPGFALAALYAVPASFLAPFNPPALILAMAALALIAWWASKDLVSARHCRRHPVGDVA
jgi:DoxX-like protein/polyketide cyclase/dehydrase/lipid transport protein